MRKVAATTIVIMVMAAIIIGSCTQGDKQINLRFKYEPGMLLSYEQVSKRKFKVIEADSVVKKDTSTYKVDVEMEFKQYVDDTTAEISERGKWVFTEPNKEDSTKIDTITRETETLLRVLANGKIIDAEFVSDRNEESIAYIKNYYEQGAPVFPSGEKPIGYSWTQSTKVVLPEETMEASTTYVLKSEVRQAGYDCAVIEYEGTMILPVLPNPKDSTHRSGVDKIKTKGVMYFAHKEGIVVEQKENWVMDGDRQAIKDGKTVTFKIETEYNVTYRLVRRESET